MICGRGKEVEGEMRMTSSGGGGVVDGGGGGGGCRWVID